MEISKEHYSAVKALIKKYRRATVDELKTIPVGRGSRWGAKKAQGYSGFGTYPCTLCVSVENKCNRCVHATRGWACFVESANTTYNAITSARTYASLVKALRERADYLEKILGECKISEHKGSTV